MRNTDGTGSLLMNLSDELANAVEHSATSVVTVYGRRRMPATGIVWNDSGLIVSANHVVERDDDIHIDTPDGRHLSTTVVGRDPNTDLVLLSVETANLISAVRATGAPRVGQLVLAVGRPGKSGPMASFGVISLISDGTHRNHRRGQLGAFFKTDAAMLPGFSGGPLIDANGAMLGLNSSTLGRGSGFTLANETIERVITSLQHHGKVRRGFLGVSTQAVTINEHLVTALALDNPRALVVIGLEPGGPAEQQGMLIGDLVIRVAGTPVSSVDQLIEHLDGDVAGKQMDIELIRGGVLTTISVIAGERA